MDWKNAAEEAVEDIKEDGLIGGTKDLREEYSLDQQELGKILIISSITLFVASVPAALTLQEAYDSVEKSNNKLNEVQGVVTSDRFQQNLDTMEERVRGSLSTTLKQVSSSMAQMNSSVSELEQTEEKLEKRSNTFKWLSLISILGFVSGIVTIYV